MDENPYASPTSLPADPGPPAVRWRGVTAVILTGLGTLAVAGAVVGIGGTFVVSMVDGDSEALRIVPGMAVYLAAGVMWIRAGTAFRKSRVLRGAALAVLGVALQMASVLLMQAMLS